MKRGRSQQRDGLFDRVRSWGHLACRVIVGVAVLLGVLWIGADAILYFSTSKDFKVRRILVSGNHWASEESIRQLAAIEMGTNIWFVPSVKVAQRIARHPWVRSCRVEKIPPDCISIAIEERQPVCALLVRPEGVLYGLDAEGRVLPAFFPPHVDLKQEISKENLLAIQRLPFVTGPPAVLVPGQTLDDERYLAALRLLVDLRELSPTFYDHVDSIHVSRDGWMELFPTRLADRILLPAAFTETLPRTVIAVWNFLGMEEIEVDYVDARFLRAGVALKPKRLDRNRWYELCRRNNPRA